jgi:hypothetical protein
VQRAWLIGAVVTLRACTEGGPSAPSVVQPPSEDEAYIDDDGFVKARGPGSSAPSDLGLPNDVVRIRCIVSDDGRVFGCHQLMGPPVVEDRLVAALKKLRVTPTMKDGRPIEARRTFVFRVRFLMR